MRSGIVVCALCVLALSVADDKRQDFGAAPFVLGSRYGRSPPRLLAPRNDRFFMGSRYGKRSASRDSTGPLLCRATAVTSLYRCAPLSDPDRSEQESADQ